MVPFGTAETKQSPLPPEMSEHIRALFDASGGQVVLIDNWDEFRRQAIR